jgi:hypothetical protein
VFLPIFSAQASRSRRRNGDGPLSLLWCAAFGVGFLASGCHAVPDESPEVRSPIGVQSALQFSYGTPDGGEFTSAQTYGRATVVLFVTTFDLASQVQAERLNQFLHGHRPRINAGAVVLEAPKYALLADAFRSSLSLDYPVAIADDETRSGSGPFGFVGRVPTLVVLDATGREVWRKSGITPSAELKAAVDRAQR